MRAVNYVDNLEFDFSGPVVRNGLALGDVDNDGNYELVVGNEAGDIVIFKGVELWQTIHGLGFVSCVVIGDILNRKQNCLTIISADGWVHIYCCLKNMNKDDCAIIEQGHIPSDTVDGLVYSTQKLNIKEKITNKVAQDNFDNDKLECIHIQRIPANSKVALLGDVDGDGSIELVLGLTDRVVRSYRWVNSPQFVSSPDVDLQKDIKSQFNISGRLVGLNKWECANQIGSVTLHHSSDGAPCLLVAQPGGTFMRIKCQPEDFFGQSANNFNNSENSSENFAASFVDYQFLGLSRMRNQNISTEILGDLKTIESNTNKTVPSRNSSTESTESQISEPDTKMAKLKGNPYAVCTLDGTIMLVEDEIILWAIQVDHQTFALSKLDVTGNGADDIIVCSWDGQTYILDQEKNSVRFQLDEPVQAFCSGFYNIVPGEPPVPCLVYMTFWNKLYIYFDIKLDSLISKRFNPELSNMENIEPLIKKIAETENLQSVSRRTKQKLVQFLLYGVKKPK